MLIIGIVLGLVVGLLAGGRFENLFSVRLRLLQPIFLGLLVRIATEAAIAQGNAPADALRLPLFVAGFALILLGLWGNRQQPGLSIAFVGVLLNIIPIALNGGYMPVWEPAYTAAGFGPGDAIDKLHTIVPGVFGADFVLHAGFLGDVIPIPGPLPNVASVGDVFVGVGLAFFLFASVVRASSELDPEARAAIAARLGTIGHGGVAGASATVVARGLGGSAAIDRPVVLGGTAVGADVAAAEPLGGAAAFESAIRGAIPGAIPIPARPGLGERLRAHPYVRLALDGSFSALWTGQLISLIGDRIHQVALAFVVLNATGSPLAVGVVFFVATLPNLLFGPIAGTLVDRWDHREVMIVADLLRAGLVLLIPLAAVTNLALVYPLVFLVTTVSIFFRPAKGAILPRIVRNEDDLLAANSAMWVADTFADIGGYVLAGLFVALLGSQLPLAFWVDAVTYIGSAILIASVAVAPMERAIEAAEEKAAGFFGELVAGWRFLRSESVLLANTLQATVGQFMLGIFLALTPVYAADALDLRTISASTAYSFIEGAIGAGNLVGGFVIGLIGARVALGKMVILGYVWTGAAVAALALTGNVAVAVALAFGAGIGNLAFVIPSQTLVQRRTPPEMMGRLLGFRFSLVFGSMTLAMAVGGVLGQAIGAAPVLGIFGVVTVVAGLAGLLVPAVRDA